MCFDMKKPLEYYGANKLNEPQYFKGGIPALHAMSFFGSIAVFSVILLNFINVIFALVILSVAVFTMLLAGKKIGKENLKGDRNYMASLMAWNRSPREVRDYSFFKRLNDEHKRSC